MWECTVVKNEDAYELRLGLNYVRGLRQASVKPSSKPALGPLREPFRFVRRVPQLSKEDLRCLAEIGALNYVEPDRASHRRDALWHTEAAMRPAGPLLEDAEAPTANSPPSRRCDSKSASTPTTKAPGSPSAATPWPSGVPN